MSDGASPSEIVMRPVDAGRPRRHPRPARTRLRPGRFARTAYRIREGTGAFSPFCRVCLIDGRLVAAVRFTPIVIGGKGGRCCSGRWPSTQPSPTGATAAALSQRRWRTRALPASPWSCWWAMSPTTANSASGASRPARSRCRARSTPTGCWRPNLTPGALQDFFRRGCRGSNVGLSAQPINPGTDRASGSCRRARGWSRAAPPGTDQLLDAAHVFDRLRRQLGPGARAARRSRVQPSKLS